MYTVKSRESTKKIILKNWDAIKGEEENHIKFSIKTREGRKKVEDQKRRGQGQQIKNSSKYGRQ